MIADSYHEELIIAGFGGQGVIVLGKLLAYAAMKAGLETTYMPSYGPEVRGGTANSQVVIATELIACPIVTAPDAVIVMNDASLARFGPQVKNGGLAVLNSSLIRGPIDRDDIECVAVPADEIALRLDSPKSANMVMLGAYLQSRELLDAEVVVAALGDVLAPRHHHTIPANRAALLEGMHYVAPV